MSSSTASTSGFIPHPPMFLKEVRPLDIALLLGVGFGWEFLCRLFLLALKMKPRSLLKKEATLEALQRETNHMRKMGPSKFVETAKLERQVLAKEKEMEQIKAVAVRKHDVNIPNLCGVLWCCHVYVGTYGTGSCCRHWWSRFQPCDTPDHTISSELHWFCYESCLMGLDDANNSMGALVCFCSGQMFATKIMDAMDALFL